MPRRRPPRAPPSRPPRQMPCASPMASTSRSTCNTGSGLSMVASGDFGRSFEYGRPVTEVIGDRLWLTILLSLGAIVVTWGLALADRHLLRGAAILDRRLRLHLPRLHRPGHPQLPAGADRDVFRTASCSASASAACSPPTSNWRHGAGPRSSTCCSICRCRADPLAAPAPRSSCASCAPTCWMSCAGPTW